MFRRIINNNVKTIGVRRLSSDSNIQTIVKELKEMNQTLVVLYINSLCLNVLMCIKSLKH